jgi:haloalkane dehalogenase
MKKLKFFSSRSFRILFGIAILVLSALVLPRMFFPPQPQLSEEVWRGMFPFKSQYVDLKNGARVHYVDVGQGPTLLLLHGNPTSSFLYRHMIAELKSDYRVVVPDYPGFGRSTAPAGYGFTAQEQADSMVAFFDRLELDDVVIMVQDWGGPIGFNLAQQRVEHFAGFIIGNTWAWPLEGQRRYEIFSGLMGGPIGRWVNNAYNGVVHIFLKRGMVSSVDDDAYAGYFQTFLNGDRTPVTVFPRELIAATPFLGKVEAGMAGISEHQALIVWGEQDFAFGEAERRRLESIFPNHSTILLPSAGHFLQEDAPDEIAAAIRQTFPSNPVGADSSAKNINPPSHTAH